MKINQDGMFAKSCKYPFEGGERPDRIAMSEKTYHGDSELDQ